MWRAGGCNTETIQQKYNNNNKSACVTINSFQQNGLDSNRMENKRTFNKNTWTILTRKLTTIQELTIIDTSTSSSKEFRLGLWGGHADLVPCGTHPTTFRTFEFLFHRIFLLHLLLCPSAAFVCKRKCVSALFGWVFSFFGLRGRKEAAGTRYFQSV